ncbi:MAG: ATP-binding cassette domain-containing protein [Bradyrhizobium sp.]
MADVGRMFERFPILKERRGRLASLLSGGEQQLLAIARACLSKPRLLLLDEPSLGLAPKMTDHVFSMIGDLRSEGLTIMLVEQKARQTLKFADRAYVLETRAHGNIGGRRASLPEMPRCPRPSLAEARSRRTMPTSHCLEAHLFGRTRRDWRGIFQQVDRPVGGFHQLGHDLAQSLKILCGKVAEQQIIGRPLHWRQFVEKRARLRRDREHDAPAVDGIGFLFDQPRRHQLVDFNRDERPR